MIFFIFCIRFQPLRASTLAIVRSALTLYNVGPVLGVKKPRLVQIRDEELKITLVPRFSHSAIRVQISVLSLGIALQCDPS